MMIRTVTHKILKISVAVSLIAHSVLSPVSLSASKPISSITTEHIFEISDETRDFARDDLLNTGKEVAQDPQFSNNQENTDAQDEWNWGWENDTVVDESDLDTFFPETKWQPSSDKSTVKKSEKQPQKYLSDPDQIVSIEEKGAPTNNPVIDKVLSLSKKKRVPNSPSSLNDPIQWDFKKVDDYISSDISSAKTRSSNLIKQKKEMPNPFAKEKVAVQEPKGPVQTSLGKKIVTVDPYLKLKEDKQKPQKQTLSSSKKAAPPANIPVTASLSGPNQPKAEIAEVKPKAPAADDDKIIAQALPDRSLSSSQGKTPPKTILINFNNVSIIEYIRFISRITNRNFIFDENDLQFNVTIISEDPTTIENVMTALIQELRIHGLYLIEQDNNLIIHRNKEERSISRVSTNGAPDASPRESELVTQVFRLNTLDPGRAQRIINPLLSNNAIIEISEDTRHIIITDLVTNIKNVEILFKDIDSPNSGLVIGQYVVRNAFIDNLIELANKIMEPIAQDQSLTFVPHPAAKSIFIVASPFLVERSISVLQHLDQFQGATRIYDLDELKFQQIAPKEAAPDLAPDKGIPGVPQEGVITPGLPTLPTLPQDIDLPEPVTPTVPKTPLTKKPAEDGKWELGPKGNWIFRPGFPSGASDPSQLPQGQWLLDPQDNWYFEPQGVDSPFQRSGIDPQTRGGDFRNLLMPGEAPRGNWLLDPQGAWIFQLSPGEDLKPVRFSRPAFVEQELPPGRIERTQFLIHKLQYRRGEDIRIALENISGSLSSCGTVNEDLICAIQSVQWLEASNSMIFAGTPSAIEKVKELINEIDHPLRQVFIEMLILETTLDDSLNYGVSWATRSGGGSTATAQAYIGGASPLVAALSGNPINNNPDSSNLATGIGYTLGVIGQRLTHNGTQFASLGALVSAQHQRSDSNVVLNPKIITEDNKTAELFVGINTRFQTDSISNDEGSVITTNFEYRDVGTTIRVTPLIGNGDIVTLEIEEEVSRVSPQSSEGEGSDTTNSANAPTTSISRTSTTVHVPDKHFVIISGLVQDERIHSRNQFPCLGGIPIIGAAFSAKVNSDAKRTQMLFIRPCIIDTDEEMRQLTCDQQEIYKQKNRTKKMWKYEVDEGMDYLNIKPPCCDECD